MPYIAIFLLIILIPIAIGALSLAPWVPTRGKDLERIHSLITPKPGSTFCEIGSGNGKVSHYIAKNNPTIDVVGIEIAYPLYLWAQIRKLFSPTKNLTFQLRDALKMNLSHFDMIYVYSMPEPLEKKLKQKFLQELRPGTQIISYAFAIGGLEPKLVSKPSNRDIKIRIYEIP